MDYAKRFPQEPLPSLWFFDKAVRNAGLQTHEPKKRIKGMDIVKRLRFPIQSIVKLGRIVTYDLKLDTFYEIYVLKLDSG